MQELVRELGDQEVPFLRSLALVQMKLGHSDFNLDGIAKLLRKSKTLGELDISGNNLQPRHFPELFKALAFNKMLHNLNLSWNEILDRTDQNTSNKVLLRNW